MIQWVEVLRSKDDLDQVKTKVLYELLEGFSVSPLILNISGFEESSSKRSE